MDSIKIANQKNNTEKNKIDKVSFLDKIDNLFTPERRKIFLKNIQNKKLADTESDFYDQYFENGDDIIKDIYFHQDICRFIDGLVFNFTDNKYKFINSYDEDGEYYPKIRNFRLFNIQDNSEENVDKFMEDIRNGIDSKIDVAPTIVIDGSYDVNLQDVLKTLIIELKLKDEDLHQKIIDLFFTSNELLKIKISEAYKNYFNEGNCPVIDGKPLIDFYKNIFEGIDTKLFVSDDDEYNVGIKLPVEINGINCDILLNCNNSFSNEDEAFEVIKELLRQEQIISGQYVGRKQEIILETKETETEKIIPFSDRNEFSRHINNSIKMWQDFGKDFDIKGENGKQQFFHIYNDSSDRIYYAVYQDMERMTDEIIFEHKIAEGLLTYVNLSEYNTVNIIQDIANSVDFN